MAIVSSMGSRVPFNLRVTAGPDPSKVEVITDYEVAGPGGVRALGGAQRAGQVPEQVHLRHPGGGRRPAHRQVIIPYPVL